MEAGYGATYGSINPPAMGVQYGTTVTGYDLFTGEELWTEELPDEAMYSGSCAVADHGKVAILLKNGYWKAFDLATGNLAWKSEIMDYPWGAASFGGYAVQSAYGMLFRQSYDGVYAFNWDDGTIAWHYKDPANPYETPYRDTNTGTLYSFDQGAWIADGKMYTLNNEHTPTPPITRGWGVNCIDIFTGERVWKIEGISDWVAPGPISDGYLTVSAADGYLYVFGKGESETTVMAPLSNVAKGSPITITGSVLDMSPGQPGTPCVSADSMSTQMQYLHIQYPIDGIWHNETITGVPVLLTAISQDGMECIDLGTTTTEGYYGTFGFTWTPQTEGTYEIVASFAGDDAYGSSAAATWITVGPAASAGGTITPEPQEPSSGGTTPTEPTPEEPTPEQPTPAEPTPEEPEPTVAEQPLISAELAIVIAVVAACIIGAVAYIALRRRK